MKNASKAIAMILVLILLSSSFIGCTGIDFIDKPLQYGFLIVALILGILMLIGEGGNLGEAEPVDGLTIPEQILEPDNIYLVQTKGAPFIETLNALPERETAALAKKIDSVPETEMASFMVTFYAMPERELGLAIDELNSLSKKELRALVKDLNSSSETAFVSFLKSARYEMALLIQANDELQVTGDIPTPVSEPVALMTPSRKKNWLSETYAA